MKRRLDYTLYLVTDSNLAGGRELESIVRQAVRGGVTVVQLREKDLSSRDFFCLALQLRAVTDSLGIPLIINDRPDIARASGAAGVHLGQDDLPCRVVRSIVGPDMVIGVSVSTVEEATEAEADGADYLGVSPIFQTATKTDTPIAEDPPGSKYSASGNRGDECRERGRCGSFRGRRDSRGIRHHGCPGSGDLGEGTPVGHKTRLHRLDGIRISGLARTSTDPRGGAAEAVCAFFHRFAFVGAHLMKSGGLTHRLVRSFSILCLVSSLSHLKRAL